MLRLQIFGNVTVDDTMSNPLRNRCFTCSRFTDNDGVIDLIDLDDDNDGVLDTTEQATCAGPVAVTLKNINGTATGAAGPQGPAGVAGAAGDHYVAE